MRPRFIPPAAGAGAALLLALLAGGCGGGSSSSAATNAAATTTSTTAGPKTAPEQALFTYAACMRSKGVDIPDPVRGANGRYAFRQIPPKVLNAPGVRAKAQACAAKLPRGSFRRGKPPSKAQRAALQKFDACMRRNGASLRAPSTGGRQSRPNGRGAPPVDVVPGQRLQGQGARAGPGDFFFSNDPKLKEALAKCRSLLPQGFADRGAPTP